MSLGITIRSHLLPPFSWLWDGWMAFSKALGKVMSAIILTILWIIGFGLYGIVLKIIALTRKEEPKASYWVTLEKNPQDNMKYQF